MCCRIASEIEELEYRGKYGVKLKVKPSARYNIAPGEPVLAVVSDEHRKNVRMVKHLMWGLVPSWADDPTMGFKMINARGETLLQKASFKQPFRRRRCLVPVSGFYEWDRKQTPRQPYWFALANGQSMALGGIWEHWQDAQGTELETLSIITTRANRLVGEIHERMPVMIRESDYDAWLFTDETRVEELFGMLKPCPEGVLKKHPVSTRVNKTGASDRTMIEAIEIKGEQGYLF